MGRGLALQAKQKFPGIDVVLGKRLRDRGNRVLTLHLQIGPEKIGIYPKEVAILSFPTKNDWRDPADLDLIVQSCRELHLMWEESQLVRKQTKTVVLPRVGCGNGRRSWDEIKPILQKELPEDSFVVVSLV